MPITPENAEPLFGAGQVLVSLGAIKAMGMYPRPTVQGLLDRHVRGNYGYADAEQVKRNTRAIVNRGIVSGEVVLSTYRLPYGTMLCVVTDERGTTILLREEY